MIPSQRRPSAIRISATTRDKKGPVFENFVRRVLFAHGYDDFRTVRKTGRQIDIKGKHRVTGQPVLCECKAYAEELEADHLMKFRGLWETERNREPDVVGLFFSLSGFGGGFLELYDEWEPSTKERIRLFGPDAVLDLMSKSAALESRAAISMLMKTRVPYAQEESFLCVSEHGEHWSTIFNVNNRERVFAMVSGRGEDVPRYIIDAVAAGDPTLKKLGLVSLDLRHRIILTLTDMSTHAPSDLSKLIGESTHDVEASASRLISDRILKQTESGLSLSPELDVFITVACEFLQSAESMEFIKSAYAQSQIGAPLLSHIQARWLVNFDVNMIDTLVSLLRVSPTALNGLLTSSTERIRTGREQIDREKLPETAESLWQNLAKTEVLMLAAKGLVADLEKPHHTDVLARRGIKGCTLEIGLKLVSLRDVYLRLGVASDTFLLTAAESMQAGQLVRATGPGALFEMAAVDEQLGRLKQAIKVYDDILLHETDPDTRKTALNNQGVVYRKDGKLEKATECLRAAAEIDDANKEVHFNLGLSLLDLRLDSEGIAELESALAIDPGYSNAAQALEAARAGWHPRYGKLAPAAPSSERRNSLHDAKGDN
jgi:tetratricopeptide (TPR) repeat protein